MHELPESAQNIIGRQLSTAGDPAGAFSEAAAQRPWAQTATEADYVELAAVSEYASWVLAHGYALNHMTVAVHRLLAADDSAKPAFRRVTHHQRRRPWRKLWHSLEAQHAVAQLCTRVRGACFEYAQARTEHARMLAEPVGPRPGTSGEAGGEKLLG